MNRALRPEDRRRFGRIHFETPLAARVGDARAGILDLALNGARVTSDARFKPTSTVELRFNSEVGDVDARCRVVRCTLAQFAKSPAEKSVYQTGLLITETVGESDRILREVIAQHVIRALEEQKANAHGVPPIEQLVHERVVDRYRRCELADKMWRRSETTSPEQPAEGFTIAADVELRYVDLLCETYMRGDEEARRLTKMLAQLSVTKGEGVPIRKYLP